MTNNVSAENERFIRQAVAEGRFANWDEAINEAVHLLREESSDAEQHSDGPDSQAWAADLRNWAANHRRVEQPVDFDRSGIYSDRGK
jgi:Arc/MetJ-type ribon-helix-helix transcriptional regulator